MQDDTTNIEYQSFVPITEFDLKSKHNFFLNNIKDEESLIIKTNDSNISESNSIDPRELFKNDTVKSEKILDTIILPSNTFNFNVLDSKKSFVNSQSRRNTQVKNQFNSLIDNSNTKFVSKSNLTKSTNLNMGFELKSRNKKMSLNTLNTMFTYNRKISKYETNFKRNKDDEKDFFKDFYTQHNKLSVINQKISRISSLNKYNDSHNMTSLFQKQIVPTKRIERNYNLSATKISSMLTSSNKKDSFFDFTIKKKDEFIFKSRENVVQTRINKLLASSYIKGSKLLTDIKFKNIHKGSFNL